MRVHFIAIGGSAMHNLAIALHKKGYQVTGSDDEIFEPSKTRLASHGILPSSVGWNTNNIDQNLDAVVLGMHAREDNPELVKAQELGLKIYSYPEYLYEQAKDKKRVVIGGSHGKTTITAMILHVLHHAKIDCDYMVGAQLAGFDTMVRLTEEAPIAIFEGDEYLSSPIDRRPKFHLYKPHIALISGIAWDHINVFPTFENYVDQFRIFIDQINDEGILVYCETDAELKKLVEKAEGNFKKIPYSIPGHTIEDGITFINLPGTKLHKPLEIFGDHNLMNLNGARMICNELGVEDDLFYESIASFKGASNRMELVCRTADKVIYKDFAHSPSKVSATVSAVKRQFPDWNLVACLELHTFSSLNDNFLQEYNGSMSAADEAIVYFNPDTIAHKKLKVISPEQVINAFGGDVKVITESNAVKEKLKQASTEKVALLMMSSGNFDGMDFAELADDLGK